MDVMEHMEEMSTEFPIEFDKNSRMRTPAGVDLFGNKDNDNKTDEDQATTFHRTVAKGSFASHRGRPDLKPVIAALQTQAKKPKESDWMKSVRMMRFMHTTKKDRLFLKAGDPHRLA